MVIYLAELYLLDGDLVMATVRSNALSATDPIAGFLETAGIYGESADRLRAITPPPSAEELHAAKLAFLERQFELIEPAVAAVDANDQAAFNEAISAYVGGLTELLTAGVAADRLQADLAREILDERGEASASYLGAVLQLRTSEAATAVGELLPSAIQGTPEAVTDLAVVLESLSESYAALDPPPEHLDLHTRQLDLMAAVANVMQLLADALATGEPPDPDTLRVITEYSAESPRLNADWSYATAIELHPEFDPSEYGEPEIEGELSAMPPEAGLDETATNSSSPTVHGQDFAGNNVAIEDDGRAKAIVFLAHWCPHCQTEVPRVQTWLEETGGVAGVDLYSVSTSMNSGAPNFPASAWLESEGWSVPVIRDDGEDSVHRAFGGGGFPFWVFVNADGTVAARVSGETTVEALEALLMALAG